MNTAAGDLTAYTFHLGYFYSIVLFAAVITIPAVGYWRFGWNAIFAFWFAYVVTRPLGASCADWMGKPVSLGGLGFGQGRVSLAMTVLIVCLVAYLAVTLKDVQRDREVTNRSRREASPAPGSAGLAVRVLLWLLLLVAAMVVSEGTACQCRRSSRMGPDACCSSRPTVCPGPGGDRARAAEPGRGCGGSGRLITCRIAGAHERPRHRPSSRLRCIPR